MTAISFQEWISGAPGARFAPLFDTDPGLVVRTQLKGRNERRLLLRHPAMEEAMVETVESGLGDPRWRGLLYVMAWGTEQEVRPLYIGMARKEGRKRPISANLAGIRTDRGKFGRWGDGSAYHIGDLSQALFKFAAYKRVEAKYQSWAATLFRRRAPPQLVEPVMLVLIPWFEDSVGPSGSVMTVAEVEKELIELASAETDGRLLNVMDVPWWATSSVAADGPPIYIPQAPTVMVQDAERLEACCEAVSGAGSVGLDVETTFIGRRLCLVQLATATVNYLIDPLALDHLSPLNEVLQDQGVEKIVHNAAFERSVFLARGVQIRGAYDTLVASRQRHGHRVQGGHSLAAVCLRELRFTLDKSVQCSDWAGRPLTPRQQRYAAADAEVLLKLGRRFKDSDTLTLPFRY